MSSDINTPTDAAQVRQLLALFADPVVELRQLKIGGRPRTDSGYFNDLDAATREVVLRDNGKQPPAMYCTLNPPKPELLARANNRMVEWAPSTTTDAQIVRRRYIFWDLDPKRAAGIPSTDAEHQHAIDKANAIAEFLRDNGAGEPIVMSSGNGAYVLLPVDLPNDADAETLVKRILLATAQHFDDDIVSVDKTVSNAGRILRVAGTVNAKGDGTPDRPHRRATLLHVPDYLANGWNEPTSREVLERIASLAVDEKPKASPNRQTTGQGYAGPQRRLMVDAWLNSHGVPFKVKQQGDRTAYTIDCPFNPEHVDDAAIFQGDDGKLGAKCFHASCAGNGWQEFKAAIGEPDGEHFDPPKRARQSSVKATVVAAAEPWNDDEDGDRWTSIKTDEGRTEAAFARRFLHAYSENVRYVPQWDEWLYWDGNHWSRDIAKCSVTRLCQAVSDGLWHEVADYHTADAVDYAESMSNPSKWNVALKAAAPYVVANVDELDSNPFLFNTPSGTVDLRTGELRPHDRADLITKLCPTPYDDTAGCPTWLWFLDGVFPDREIVAYLQRYFGWCLTGLIREHLLHIAHGNGSNGKSKLFNTVLSVMGLDYSMQAAPDLLVERKSSTHPTEQADLFGMRLVVATETEGNAKLAESLVKQLTGGDRIRARRMREDFWQFEPTHKLVLCTNHKPRIRGQDHGIWRRLRLLPFNAVFGKGTADEKLPEKLLAEAPGILAWMVAGAVEWLQVGLQPPHAVQEATGNYKTSQDVVGKFISECCVVGEPYTVRFPELRQAFEQWATENGENMVSPKVLGQYLLDRGCEPYQANGRRYRGIGLQA